MKRKEYFFTTMLAVLLVWGTTLFAQVEVENNIYGDRAYYLQVPSTNIDSVETVYTEWFQFVGWDTREDYLTQNDTSGTLSVTYTPIPMYGTYKLTSTTGKPRITWFVQGSYDQSDTNSTKTLDTLSTIVADSIETLQNFSWSNATPYLWYRFGFKGEATNRDDTYIKIDGYLPKARKP